MKALTVQQPWAWAIIHGGKNIENRTQQWSYRGPLAIHAGTRWSDRGPQLGAARVVRGGGLMAKTAPPGYRCPGCKTIHTRAPCYPGCGTPTPTRHDDDETKEDAGVLAEGR